MKKNQIIYILLGLLFLLFIIKIAFTQSTKIEKTVLPTMTTELIKTKVDSVLELYELDKKWIRIKSSKNNNLLFYNVKLPIDLPIPVLIADIKEIVQLSSTELKIEEHSQITGATSIDFINDKETLINLKFEYDKKITRKRISFGFVLYDISDISQNELKIITILPHHFIGLLTPSIKNIPLKDSLTSHQKSFAVLLNHNIKDEKYIIRNSFSKLRIRNSIINIFNDFRENKGLYIEENFYSKINNHKTYIDSELSRLNFEINSFKNLINLREKEIIEQKSLFKYYMETNPNKNNVIFLANAKDFLNLIQDIEKYKKKGNKLLSF